ncbi:FAD-binding monooxygenase [Kitasatospora sp. NBC_00240]|uniref:NAD(P)/FAD-dependent oxidoreductase n=1 Tax=Kitasatospora sp. NBC_00240 TaxID=2903567 RepID=UPI0022528940|nr:FAD-dependent monooxygenase [Kitasatospora sp. NBC_00240]MCX5214650.1 FAD-binding monooxygenase [Kitasatospora sp. NBC_00240]
MKGEGRRDGHAVVAGAGIGGLLAARALSETYGRVTVLERDALPQGGAPRRGVPQSHHSHGMLSRGFDVLEELFPGLGEDLVAGGALVCDAQADVRWFNDGHELLRAPSGLPCLLVSRPALERYLRSRVAALPGVEIHDRCEVLEPVAADGGTRITGVRLLRVNSEPETVPADLFVDSTGRGNRGATWLGALGYEPPQEERVDSELVYVSREYRRRPGAEDADAYVVGASADAPRGGVALSGEGDRWLVTLFGMNGDNPPLDPEGYHRFAERLPVPDLHRLLSRLEPLTEPRLMRIPVSIRRRYDRLERLPQGYLVFGDAICQFNPTYGQGMTVAACEAIALRDCLAQGSGDQAVRRFLQQATEAADVPWDMSVGADLRFPFVKGRRTLRVKLLNRYVSRLHRAAAEDTEVGRAFLWVANLKSPPQRLFAPRVLARVLRRRPVATTVTAVTAVTAATAPIAPAGPVPTEAQPERPATA